ncbi:MAG: UTP--glucose-1-phosphate uridylyltransferase [Clostridia bacterium]|nr:UTP--glucose-1-phosphate uridylyltransferase [Clostridia bacterium]
MNVREKLQKLCQEQLLRFEKELSKEQLNALGKQIEEMDFSYLEEMNKEAVKSGGEITPIKAMTINEINENYSHYEKIGLDALKKGEIGLVLVAGGMGTRLGSDHPKGVYNIGKTRDVFIFQRLFENALEVVKKCGRMMPFFIMTSDKNDKETRQFLAEKNYFGYDKNLVNFFVQDMAPCVDLNGKVLLEEKGKVASSPNGNGGWFNSLLKDKQCVQMLETSGVKWLNIFAVDNVLQKVGDPVFVGATLEGGFEIGAKVIRKADPYEKVGVMCKRDGSPSVIEYIDLTDDMAHAVDEKGERLYNFGVIFNYLYSLDLLYKIKDEKLPLHIVTKKVEYVNEKGDKIKPETPNAHKFEYLNVDMVELASRVLPFEVIREKEFAPIKNKEGVDSVESARKLLELNGYIL